MNLLRFGLTHVGLVRKHEFGIAHNPKFTRIDMLFFTLILLNKSQNKSLSQLMRHYAFSETDLDWHPQVRNARRKAESKGRAIGERHYRLQNERLIAEAKTANKRYEVSERENRELRQTIRGMKLVGFVEEQIQTTDDGETPAVIIEASN